MGMQWGFCGILCWCFADSFEIIRWNSLASSWFHIFLIDSMVFHWDALEFSGILRDSWECFKDAGGFFWDQLMNWIVLQVIQYFPCWFQRIPLRRSGILWDSPGFSRVSHRCRRILWWRPSKILQESYWTPEPCTSRFSDSKMLWGILLRRGITTIRDSLNQSGFSLPSIWNPDQQQLILSRFC